MSAREQLLLAQAGCLATKSELALYLKKQEVMFTAFYISAWLSIKRQCGIPCLLMVGLCI